VATEEDEANNIPKKLDAGALFVLKSRGINWICGIHQYISEDVIN
jgi:hypothetical protein